MTKLLSAKISLTVLHFIKNDEDEFNYIFACTMTKFYQKELATSAGADPIKLFFLRFPIFTINLKCLLYIGKITDSKMTQLSSKKRRNSLLSKKKSFIGSATGRETAKN